MQDDQKEYAIGLMQGEKLGNAIFEFMGIADPARATREERLLWLKGYVALITAIYGREKIANALGGEITTGKVLAAYKEGERYGLVGKNKRRHAHS